MVNFDVDITPDKTLIQKLGLVGYRTEQAIAELLDNSIDARVTGILEKIWLVMNFEEKWIGVSDDGVGMDKEEIVNGMTIARGTKTDDKLGKFGMGMKSACSALGKKFTITTSKINSNKEYEIEYDEDTWLSDKSRNWDNFMVKEKILDDKDNWHGTKVIISKLNIPLYGNQVSKFKESFGIRYSPYLESKQVSIQINTVTCNPVPLDIVQDSKIDLSISLEKNRVIHGYVALLKKRSIKGHYGIHLFKNGRLIKAFEKFGFSSHPENAKVVGELHLDHVPVNFSKSEFIQENPEYEESVKAFASSEIVKKILSSSRSQGEVSPTINSILNYFAGNSDAQSLNVKMRTKMAKELLDNYEPFEIQMESMHVLFTFESADDDSLYVILPEKNHVKVLINKNSSAFSYVTNPLFLIGMITTEIKLLISDSNYQTFIEKRNSTFSKFLHDWSKKPRSITTRSRTIQTPEEKNYRLSNDLIDVRNYLEENYDFKFQFTALCTLSNFLHHYLGTLIYTVHTSPGKGDYLAELLSKKFGDNFIIINSPDSNMISKISILHKSKKIIVIREYAEIKGSIVATPEKAWVDLANEIITHKIPVSDSELKEIHASLNRRLSVNSDEIKRYASHLKKLDSIEKLLG